MSHPSSTLSHRSAVPHAVELPTRFLVPVGRTLLALIFLFAGPGHFSAPTIAYAASQGVPLAGLAVPLTGVMCLVGGLSVLLGYRARLGAALLAVFLVPTTLMLHAFWKIADPTAAQMDMIMFMKNLGLLGAALLVMHFGSGPLSLDARSGRA